MSESIHKFSHDSFFKYLMEDKENVKDLIQATLPKNIVKKLDLTTLRKLDTQRVTADLKITFADVAYNCKYNNRDITLAFLFEHKSDIVNMPHLQLLTYMLAMWRNEQKNNKQLTPIIPYIFYHGKRNWHKCSMQTYFGKIDNVIKIFIPDFDYILFDTSNLTNDQLRELFKRLPMQIGIFMMKNIFEAQNLIENLTLYIEGIMGSRDLDELYRWLKTSLLYAMGYVQENPKKIIQKMKTLSPKLAQQAKSAFDMLLEEGIQKGKEEGKKEEKYEIARKMLSLGMEMDLIMKLTELTYEEIIRLKQEMQNNN